jgi:hypothetical protein
VSWEGITCLSLGERSAVNCAGDKCCIVVEFGFRNTAQCIEAITTGLRRPRVFQAVEAPRLSRQSALEGSKVVSPTNRPAPPPPPHRADAWYLYYRCI